MIRRLVTILIAALLSVLAAGGLASGTTSVAAPRAVLAYTYSAPVYDAHGAHATPTRGPPARVHDDNTYDAAGRWSGGTSARPGGPASLAQTTYDHSSGFGQVAPTTGVTADPDDLLEGELSSLLRWQVAANMDSFLPAGATVRHSSTATAIGDDAATLTNFGRSQGAGGMHDVIVHGTADGRPIVNGNVTHARQIADAILENPSYTPGCSIRLVMCHGGREAAAQLSQMLDVDVLSTTRQAQLDPFTGQLLQGSF